jgi:hypothetical protein
MLVVQDGAMEENIYTHAHYASSIQIGVWWLKVTPSIR